MRVRDHKHSAIRPHAEKSRVPPASFTEQELNNKAGVCEAERPRHLHTNGSKGPSLNRFQHVVKLVRLAHHPHSPRGDSITAVSVTCFRRLCRHAAHCYNEASGKHGLAVTMCQLETKTCADRNRIRARASSSGATSSWIRMTLSCKNKVRRFPVPADYCSFHLLQPERILLGI